MAIQSYTELAFAAWLREVDQLIEQRAGVALLDLSDHAYRTWFEAGMAASTAAWEALHDDGFGDDEAEDEDDDS